MNKMKLVSQYKDYGNINMWDDNSPIKCVCDWNIFSNTREGEQVALLIEPRSIQPEVYEAMMTKYEEYEYVFTHDSILLKTLPNAKPILWGGVWVRDKYPIKTKLISMVCSNKEMCELHKQRKELARRYRGKIDIYGTIDGGEYVDAIDTLKDYRYSVIIENYIDDIWFSEKLLNCFATKTIPIYYGARKINYYFNQDGIINCNNIEEVERCIDEILNDDDPSKLWYMCEEEGILQDNFERSKKYENFDEWLYKTYKKEIEEMFK